MLHSAPCFRVLAASPTICRCERPRYLPPIGTVFGIYPTKRLQITYIVKATSGHKSSIGTDGHASNRSANSAGVCKGLRRPVRDLPNLRHTIFRPRYEESPVRRENDRVDLFCVTPEYAEDSPCGDTPNLECQKLCHV